MEKYKDENWLNNYGRDEVDAETKLRNIIGEVTGRDVSSVDATVDLVDYLGLDSIAGLQVVAAIERKMDVTFPDETLGKLHTIEGMLRVLEEVSL